MKRGRNWLELGLVIAAAALLGIWLQPGLKESPPARLAGHMQGKTVPMPTPRARARSPLSIHGVRLGDTRAEVEKVHSEASMCGSLSPFTDCTYDIRVPWETKEGQLGVAYRDHGTASLVAGMYLVRNGHMILDRDNSVEEVMAALGPPDRKTRLPNGNRVFRYDRLQLTVVRYIAIYWEGHPRRLRFFLRAQGDLTAREYAEPY